jgi:hypothetical protein
MNPIGPGLEFIGRSIGLISKPGNGRRERLFVAVVAVLTIAVAAIVLCVSR